MSKRFILSTAALAISMLFLSPLLAAQPQSHWKPAVDAHITLAQARVIALKAVHGKVVAEELEKEKGGSGLRYSFDIRVKGVTHEVGVDAKTGKLLENSVEKANTD